MKSLMFLFCVLFICISSCTAYDLILGTIKNATLIWQQKIEYTRLKKVPFIHRIKEVFYSDPSEQIIKGIVVRDIDDTQPQVNITAGGVGFSYVKLRFKNTRGGSLNYGLEIYA